MKHIHLLTLCMVLLAGCTPAPQQQGESPVSSTPPAEHQDEPLTLEETAANILDTLAAEDFAALAQYVHPEDGVRFTPYTHVQESDMVFTTENLASAYDGETVYTWGHFDGSGDPIGLTFDEYRHDFVWTHDFTEAADVRWDTPQQRGNAIDNAQQFYGPEARIVEYHFPGFDPQYEGMDWESLRLVLKQHNGEWKLVGVIHDQWTA